MGRALFRNVAVSDAASTNKGGYVYGLCENQEYPFANFFKSGA